MSQFNTDDASTFPELGKLSWEKSPHGYIAFATLAKVGHPLKYPDGSTQYVEKFSEDSITSLRGMPVLLGHPKDSQFLGNKEGLMIGQCLQEVLVTDSGELLTPVSVTDARGVKLIEDCIAKGLSPEVSPAYWNDRLPRSDGGFTQDRKSYDHLALLEPGQGRGGSVISLRLDSMESEVSVETLQSRITVLEAEIATLKGEKESLISLDEVNERAKIWQQVLALDSSLSDSIDYGLSTSNVKGLYLAKRLPALNLDGKDPQYIEGIFDTVISDTSATQFDISLKRSGGNIQLDSGSDDAIAKARKAQAERIAKGGK